MLFPLREGRSRGRPWLEDKEVAGFAYEPWGGEFRLNHSDKFHQPCHRVVILLMGIVMGEMFQLDGLAEGCAKDAIFDTFDGAPSA